MSTNVDNYSSEEPISSPKDSNLPPPNQPNGPQQPDYQTTVYIVNCIVMPNLRLLLGNVVNAINATVPNKDQNRAMTHIVRQAFDEMYFDVLRKAYPDCNFGQQDESYAVSPALKRSEAFTTIFKS